jgi:hypothetical protein
MRQTNRGSAPRRRNPVTRAKIRQDTLWQMLVPLLLIELVEFQGRHMAEMAERLLPVLIEFVNRLDERGGPLALPAPVVLRSLMSVMVGHLLTQMILERSPLMQQMDYDWFGTTMDVFLHGVIRTTAGRPAAPG